MFRFTWICKSMEKSHIILIYNWSISKHSVQFSPLLLNPWGLFIHRFPRTPQRGQRLASASSVLLPWWHAGAEMVQKGRARRVTVWQGNTCNPRLGPRAEERMMQKILANSAVCCWLLYRSQLTEESQVIHPKGILWANKVSKIMSLYSITDSGNH